MKYLFTIFGLLASFSFHTEAMEYMGSDGRPWNCNYATRVAKAQGAPNIEKFEAYGIWAADHNLVTVFLMNGDKNGFMVMKSLRVNVHKDYEKCQILEVQERVPTDPSEFKRFLLLVKNPSFFQSSEFESGSCYKILNDFLWAQRCEEAVFQRGTVCIGVEGIRHDRKRKHTCTDGELVNIREIFELKSTPTSVPQITEKKIKKIRRNPLDRTCRVSWVAPFERGGICPAHPNSGGLGAVDPNSDCPRMELQN